MATVPFFFETIDAQQKLLDDNTAEWMKDTKRMKHLSGYDWIIAQWESALNV